MILKLFNSNVHLLFQIEQEPGSTAAPTHRIFNFYTLINPLNARGEWVAQIITDIPGILLKVATYLISES